LSLQLAQLHVPEHIPQAPQGEGVQRTECSSLPTCNNKSVVNFGASYCALCPTFILDNEGCSVVCNSSGELCSLDADVAFSRKRPKCRDSGAHVNIERRKCYDSSPNFMLEKGSLFYDEKKGLEGVLLDHQSTPLLTTRNCLRVQM
jgi:hypothetical protein